MAVLSIGRRAQTLLAVSERACVLHWITKKDLDEGAIHTR